MCAWPTTGLPSTCIDPPPGVQGMETLIMSVPLSPQCASRLTAHGQGHLLRCLAGAGPDYAESLESLDPALLASLFKGEGLASPPDLTSLEPPPVVPAGANAAARAAGERALRAGQVAVVLVAGGQGTRLGSDQPKGCFPVGPVSGATLYQIHAEKVLALGRKHGKTPVFLIMTSSATDAATRDFFSEHGHFGLNPADVWFFRQGEMPAVDRQTGRILLEAPGKLFTAPDGHGGCLAALSRQGWLDKLAARGVSDLFYFQVDNPLVAIADPVFIGHHILKGSQASSKVILRRDPSEKLGVFARSRGRCHIVEYSDLPAAMGTATAADGSLLFGAGNPAIHLFSVPFLTRAAAGDSLMPYHAAVKKVPFWMEECGHVKPGTENALKFEKFMFDVLPHADPWLLVETPREDEFAPLKNAQGADSPQEVRAALSRLAARWLAAAGIRVPVDPAGHPAAPLEISPLAALEPNDLNPERLRRTDWSIPLLVGPDGNWMEPR